MVLSEAGTKGLEYLYGAVEWPNDSADIKKDIAGIEPLLRNAWLKSKTLNEQELTLLCNVLAHKRGI